MKTITFKSFFIILPLLLMGVGCKSSGLENKWLELEQQKEKRLLESEIFDRKIKCQEIVDKFKKRYNNTTGGFYDTESNTCKIEYKSAGEKDFGDMQFMSDY